MKRHFVFFLCLLCHVFGSKAEKDGQVFVTVKTDAILPCGIDVPTDNQTYVTYTWTERAVFLLTAKEEEGNITITYIVDSLKAKYILDANYSLIIKNVDLDDTKQYTCSVGIFRDPDTKDLIQKFENVTELYVQDVPSKPGMPQIGSLKSRTVSVWWSASTEENNSPISSYMIQVRTNTENWVLGNQVTTNIHQKNITTNMSLRPYTSYKLRIVAVNSIGESMPSEPSMFFITPSEEPEAPPSNLLATSNNSSVIHIKWDHPASEKINGELKGYQVMYSEANKKVFSVITFERTDKTELDIPGVKSYTEYLIQVAAINTEGPGPVANAAVVTAEGKPSKPRITHISRNTPSTVKVHWVEPKVINGRLQSYELQWINTNTGVVRTKVINGVLRNKISENITNLDPYTQYDVRVRAVTGGGKGQFSDRYPAMTDVTAPGAPTILNATTIGTDTVYLRWLRPKKFYRDVEEYLIEFIDLDSYFTKTKKIPEKEYEVVKSNDMTWIESAVSNLPSNRHYSVRIAGLTQSLFNAHQYPGNYSAKEFFYLQGGNESNTTEPDIPSNHSNVIIADITPDPRAIQAAEQDIMSAGIVAGIVCGILVVLLASLVFIGCRSLTCRKYYQAAYNYLAVPTNSNHFPSTVITIAEPFVEKTYLEVKVEDFIQHVKILHADTDDKFSQEYSDVNKNTRTDLKADTSNMHENKSKNRYVNITAFDHSRVYLAKQPQSEKIRQSDYINANYVDGYHKSKAYIATQGPMPSTFGDFWRMVWEQKSVVIVMITKLMEKGRKKCDKYWPEEGLEQHGNIAVKHLNTFSRAHYTVRMFSLKDTKAKKQSSERIVYQFHYTEWPDHGVPDFTLPVLKFVQKSAFANPPGAGPIVVHCSAGVGRTGTYILIDAMIEQLKDKGTINIPQFLLKIRQQRNFLVQTEEQYMLIHDALVEYLLSHDTEVRNGEINKYIQNLTKIQEDKSSLLQKQFELLVAYCPKEIDKYPALEEYNVPKNRREELVPMTTKRVQIPTKPGIPGSDYINATFLQGYTKTNEFILTQHPMESTIDDFWRMVWDKNCSVIVLLSDIVDDEQEFIKFWPEEDTPLQVDTGIFKLTCREEETGYMYTTRDFLLESTQDDYVLMTKMISCSNWPRDDQPLCKAFDLIDTIRDIHRLNDIGPVIVVDRYGGVTGCKFCALWSSLDQLQHDKTIDIYHLCKLYHKKRAGIIGSVGDYLFLYSAVESYCNDQNEKDSALASNHLILRSSKKNGTIPRSPSIQNKVPRSPSLPNNHHSSKAETNSSKAETNV
ncbi:tyrosine-protein phosphatase 99A-like isoform X4 [Mytilus trossulus]|uniref:tyrosine-protein phosphatase 99A-like isoform X4 n=1 Tax=Mytilus trossulus TaxID=6551 RepID=UPI003007D707